MLGVEAREVVTDVLQLVKHKEFESTNTKTVRAEFAICSDFFVTEYEEAVRYVALLV